MARLSDRVALVAGASRGCGRGLAVALGEEGATVYVTARTVQGGDPPPDGAPGTIEETAEEVTQRGGKGLACAVDHTDPTQVDALFARIQQEQGRLDVACCATWGGNERYSDPRWKEPFWKQPSFVWRECMGPGAEAFWLVARGAAALMTPKHSGLIVAITEPTLEGAFEGMHATLSQTLWGLAHYSINGLVKELGRQSKTYGVAVIGLLPGFMRTERVRSGLEQMSEAEQKAMRYDLSETPEYAGRAVAALAADPDVTEHSGKLLYVADLAETYGFTDVDGKRVGNFYRELGLVP